MGIFLFSYCRAEEQLAYDAKGKRNPFIPLITEEGRPISLEKEEVAKGDLSVEGIIFDKRGRSYAIINGAVLGIGDSVAGYQILKIENNKVVFIKEGQIKEIEMQGEGE